MIVVAIVCPNRFSYIQSFSETKQVAVYKAIQEAFKVNYGEEVSHLKSPEKYIEEKEGVSYITYLSSEIEGYILTKRV